MKTKKRKKNYVYDGGSWRRLVCAALLLSTSAFTHPGYANPEDGQVVGGAATIVEAGKKLDIHQHTQRAVIDWRSFNIGVDEHTEFHQPSSSATAVNRVNNADPSQILGKLTANGNIVLINPNGVFFGKDSVVDVNGLVATTADIKTQAFMDGSNNFNIPGNPEAGIVNAGTITAKNAGLVGLVAPNVENHGVITAKMGRVQLASGDTVVADFYGDGLLKVEVADEKVKSQFVGNTGKLAAEGGTVAMTAAAARQTVNSLIVAKGELKAPTVEKRGGKIIIGAAGSNKTNKEGASGVIVQASLDASGRNEGEQGGAIEILGDHIALLNGTVMDASGHSAPSVEATSGGGSATMAADKSVRSEEAFMAHENRAGGSIKVGGDYLGKGETQTAKTLYVDENVLTLNDAVENGDAGRAIFWSDDTTDFNGLVLARGGESSGHGGFLETSGKVNLRANGFADLDARTNGYNKGSYLLDPQTITIYGNVDPTFVSTDGSIDIQSNLAVWLDADDTAKVVLAYSANNITGTTATGAIGTNTITTSANVSSYLEIGSRIRIGPAGLTTTADTLGPNTYTITNVSGTTVTVAETLTTSYAAQPLLQGLVSGWNDKSGNNANATQTTAGNRPLWVSATNGLNNRGSLRFFSARSSTMSLVANLNNSAGAYNSVFYTMNWTGGNGQMPFGFTSYDMYLQGGRFGFNTAAGDNYGMLNAATILANTWVQGTSHFYNGFTEGNSSLSINGMDRALSISGNDTSKSVTDSITLSGWNNSTGYKFNGKMSEFIALDTKASTEVQSLIEQYQSAKWGMAMNKLAGAGTEVAEATAHNASNPTDLATNGYNVFTTRYLERLAESADLMLQSATGITLDLKGDTLDLTGTAAAGKSITLQTDNGSITDLSNGTIRTTRTGAGAGQNGNISLIAGGAGSISLDTTNLEALNGGLVSLTAGESINVTQNSALNLGNISGKTVSVRTTGTTSDITLNGGITATESGNALAIASGRNFINNAGSGALNASNASGRWLVYSANPSANTLGGITADFKRYNKTYAGYAPGSVTETGDGFLYSVAPSLVVTAQDVTRYYGNVNNFTYGIGTGGLIDGDTLSSIGLSGSAALTSAATQTSDAGGYTISSALGTLASDLGYQFTFNDGVLTIDKAPLTVSLAQSSYSRAQGASNPIFNLSYVGFKLGETESVLDSAPTVGTLADISSAAGQYAITIAGGMDNNYDITYLDPAGYLTVDASANLPSSWEHGSSLAEFFDADFVSDRYAFERAGWAGSDKSQISYSIEITDETGATYLEDEHISPQKGLRVTIESALADMLGLTQEKLGKILR